MTSWWDFVKANIKTLPNNISRKEKFAMLSAQWREEKASLILISATTLSNMQYENTKLKVELESAHNHIMQLEERLEYLESLDANQDII